MAKADELLISTTIYKIYNKTIDLVCAIILLFITLTMIIGIGRLFYRPGELFQQGGITGSNLYIFSNLLALFILIELSRSLFEYPRSPAAPDAHHRCLLRICYQAYYD